MQASQNQLGQADRPGLKLIITLCCLYLVQGLPIGLLFYGIPTLLRTSGFALQDVAMVQMAGIFWALKCLWSSLVENHWSIKIGKRKSWIIPMQLLIASAIFILSFINISTGALPYLAAMMGLMSIAGATQDIATDAFAAENSPSTSLGFINTIQMGGVLTGLMIAGPLSSILFEQIGYHTTCRLLAVLVFATMFPILLWQEQCVKIQNSSKASLKKFFQVSQARSSLLMCSLATVNGVVILAITKFVLIDRGWSMTQVGMITGIVHMLMMLIGCLMAGMVIKRIGYKHTLSAGLAGVLSGGLLWYIIAQTVNIPIWFVWLATLCVGLSMGFVAVSTYTYSMHFSKKTDQPGTNISIFQSTQMLGEIIFSSLATALAGTFGYGMVFIFGTCISLACLSALLKHKYYAQFNLLDKVA